MRSGAPGQLRDWVPSERVGYDLTPAGRRYDLRFRTWPGRGRRLVLQLLPALRLAIARAPIFPAIGNHDSADSEGSDDRAQMEDNFHVPERFHHGGETASVMPGLSYRLRYGAGLELACLDTSFDTEQAEIHRYFQAPKHQPRLRSTFGRRGDRWLIPYSPHPIYSAGRTAQASSTRGCRRASPTHAQLFGGRRPTSCSSMWTDRRQR